MAYTSDKMTSHGLRPVVVEGAIEQASTLTAERRNSFSRIA